MVTTIEGVSYLANSDLVANQFGASGLVLAYADRPRIVLTSALVTLSADQTALTVTHSIDLRSDSLRALPYPGQNVQSAVIYNNVRGVADSELESQILPPPAAGDNSLNSVSTFVVFEAAAEQDVPLVNITSANLSEVGLLNISVEAQARITADVGLGMDVLVPSSSVTVNGVPTAGWYETDPTSGETVGVMEDGGHEGIGQFVAILAVAGFATVVLTGCGGDVVHIDAQVMGANAAAGQLGGADPSKLKDEEKKAILAIVEKNIPKDATPADRAAFISGAKGQLLISGDPSLGTTLSSPSVPFAAGTNQTSSTLTVIPSTTTGSVAGSTTVNAVAVSGHLTASWADSDHSGFEVSAINATGAAVTGAGGSVVGSGTVSLNAPSLVPVSINGSNQYQLDGVGSLSSYGPADSSLAVAGDWSSYSATVTGALSMTLTTGGLILNGLAIPAGTYTVTASSATLGGSGTTSSPNFAGSVSVIATGGTINLGSGTGSLSVGGTPLNVDDETTLDGYSGTIAVSANGAGSNAVDLSGSTANVLQVTVDPTKLTTDQNTPITFQADLQTSLADTYTLTANAPPGWIVTIDSSGNVTATPAAGLQSGTYPIQIIAQSQTDANLEAQTTVPGDDHGDTAGDLFQRCAGQRLHRAVRRSTASHGLHGHNSEPGSGRRYLQADVFEPPQRLHAP